MKSNLKLTGTLFLLFVSLSVNTNAQLGKKLSEKLGGSKSNETTKEVVVEKAKDLNEWHKANEGKVVFYSKSIEYGSKSTDDSESNVITERVIAGDGPFSFRAYLGKSYKGFPNCDGFDIRYSIGGVSITTAQLRDELPAHYARMASNYSFYNSDNASVGVPLIADAGKYYDQYTLQEDAYRILLSKVKDKLVVGASLTLKVEIIGTFDGKANDVVMASGEVTLKVTSASSNLQSLNCRCGKAGMTDVKVIKEVTEAFEFQFDDVKKVHHVILLSRDFSLNYDNSYPVKLVTSQGMMANIVYERTDGIFLMVKRHIFFKKTDSGFSSKATIGKQEFYLPVSPTCAK